MSPAPFYARPVSALGDQSNLSTMLSRAGGRPVSRRFSGVIFLYTILCRIVNFLLTCSIEFETLTLRAGNTTTEQRLRAEGRGKYQQASRTSTEHGKLQAAQPESGRSTKANAQRESRRRQGNGEI